MFHSRSINYYEHLRLVLDETKFISQSTTRLFTDGKAPALQQADPLTIVRHQRSERAWWVVVILRRRSGVHLEARISDARGVSGRRNSCVDREGIPALQRIQFRLRHVYLLTSLSPDPRQSQRSIFPSR